MTASSKAFGIAVKLPENDPMNAPHLLGDDWQSTRWFATREERDAAFLAMEKQPAYYRRGDEPSVLLEKVDQAG